MPHIRSRLRVIAPIAIVVLIALYYGWRALSARDKEELTASGSIEAVDVNVAPEMSGKVADVFVEEGDPVSAGEPLLRLDDSLLGAQHAVSAAQIDAAGAALASAQIKYDQTLQTALAEQQAQRAREWRFSAPDEFNQPAWYFDQGEQTSAAEAELDKARQALEEALSNLEAVITDLKNADFLNAEKRLAEARAAFLVADEVRVAADNAGSGEGGGLQDAAYDLYNQAVDELNAAQSEYNSFLNSQARLDILDARGRVAVAQQRYDAATARLLGLQTGAESPVVTSALKAWDQAKAALEQAESNMALLDAQIEKLTIYAPMDGVILTRNVEPGEFVQPGAIAISMANIKELTITVYVPEDRYGEITLGQQASVRVDSFPEESFTAEVIHIADEAEFTPRNVQTVEGRSSTVYAVKLKVMDAGGKLKIGMPADVVFEK